MPKDYDTTIARIAGNIFCGFVANPQIVTDYEDLTTPGGDARLGHMAELAVELAEAIVHATRESDFGDVK